MSSIRDFHRRLYQMRFEYSPVSEPAVVLREGVRYDVKIVFIEGEMLVQQDNSNRIDKLEQIQFSGSRFDKKNNVFVDFIPKQNDIIVLSDGRVRVINNPMRDLNGYWNADMIQSQIPVTYTQNDKEYSIELIPFGDPDGVITHYFFGMEAK